MITANRLQTNSTVLNFVRQCSEALIEFVPASNAVVITLDDNLKPASVHAIKNVSLHQTNDYMRRYWKHDPLLPNGDCQVTNRVRTWSCRSNGYGGDPEHEIYGNFVKKESCEVAMRIDLILKGRIVGGLGIGRHPSLGTFTKEEIALLRKCSNLLDLSDMMSEPQSEQDISEEKMRLYKLTGREMDIISLLRAGESNKQIAGHLGIELATAKSHLINIFKKTGVNSRTALLSMLYFGT